MSLKEKYETYKLDDWCKLFSEEIDALSKEEYKLKMAFVLIHIIEESQKVLDSIDTSNFVEELKKLVNDSCEKSEKQKELLKLRFAQDKQIRDAIDGTNKESKALDNEIEPLLTRYESIVKALVESYEKLSLAERGMVKNKQSCNQ